MGFFSFAKKILKPLVDFPKWMDFKQIAKTTKNIKDNSKELFSVKKPIQKETFEEAMQRLDLTEADIAQRIKLFKWLAALYTFFALLVFIYGVYLLSHLFQDKDMRSYVGAVAGAVLSFVITFVLLAFAFRHRFWYFQVKTRYLGYTFRQWWRADVLGKPLASAEPVSVAKKAEDKVENKEELPPDEKPPF